MKTSGPSPRSLAVTEVRSLHLLLHPCSAAGQYSPGNYYSLISTTSALFALLSHLFINNSKPQVWAATGKLLGLFYPKATGEKTFLQRWTATGGGSRETDVWLALQMGWKPPYHHFKTLTLLLFQEDRKHVPFP